MSPVRQQRIRVAGDDRRLDELRKKVHDEAYIAGAIQRIAQVLSAEIVKGYGVEHGGRKSG